MNFGPSDKISFKELCNQEMHIIFYINMMIFLIRKEVFILIKPHYFYQNKET